MPSITREVAVAANTTNANAIAGAMHEFLNVPALVRIGIKASAVGLVADVIVGSVILGQAEALQLYPSGQPEVRDPHDMKWAAKTDGRIVIQLRNTTGGSITAAIYIDITFG